MADAATRKASRIRRLWPSRDLRPPPGDPPPRPRDDDVSLRSLTAHELIAMARAARARSPDP